MLSLNRVNSYFTLSCVIGVLLSCYAYVVELRKEADAGYVASCDISEHMSCTKAFSSKYGKGFGIVGRIFGDDSILNQPNSLGGIFFYTLLIILNTSEKKSLFRIQFYLSILSNFLSFYLACILLFILHDFCVVCVGTYVVNAVNLFFVLKKKQILRMNFASGKKAQGSQNDHKTK